MKHVKRFYHPSLFAICTLCTLLSARNVLAQPPRAIGAGALVLDDGSGNTITIIPSGGISGNVTFTLPIPPPGNPPSGFTYPGTAANQIFVWVMPNTTGPAPNFYPGGPQGSWQPTFSTGGGGISGISGFGTAGTIPIWTGDTTQGNSHVTDNGTTLSYAGKNINTDSAYQIGGSTVLAAKGTSNLFVGVGAGASISSGEVNTFLGVDAGHSNTQGQFNTFSGVDAGYLNSTGVNNTFSGYNAGENNTNGSANTFSGWDAGHSNTTGNVNTALGYFANMGSDSLTNATAIGANAYATQSNSLVLGSINGVNEATVSTNVGIGTTAPIRTLDVNGFINTDSAYQIGGSTVLAAKGTSNLFVGVGAGASISSGEVNTFLGVDAGYSNTQGQFNTFSGVDAGYLNSTGVNNTFSGYNAGENNTNGSANTFSGWDAGHSNTTGNVNTALGYFANMGSDSLTNATAIGANAIVEASNTIQLGDDNVTAVNSFGGFNTTVGTIQTNSLTRIDNNGNLTNIGSITTSGNSEILVPGNLTINDTGDVKIDATGNMFINPNHNLTINPGGNMPIDVVGDMPIQVHGDMSLYLSGEMLIQVGGDMTIEASHIMTIDVAAGLALTGLAAGTPTNYLALDGSNHVVLASGGGGGITGSGTAGTIPIWTGATSEGNSLLTDNGTTLSYLAKNINTDSAYQLSGSTVLAVPGLGNLFMGVDAGMHNAGTYNTFSGGSAGENNTTGYDNTFTGAGAGISNASGYYNTFTGTAAGYSSTSSNNNTFTGVDAGYSDTSGGANTFTGQRAGYANNNGFGNTFTGNAAGSSTTTGGSNTFSGINSGSSNQTGYNNTFDGADAGYNNYFGYDLTLIGAFTDVNFYGFTNSTAIGYGATLTSSNTIQLGNGNVTSVSSQGSFNTTAGGFETNGTTRIDASGNATLASLSASGAVTLTGLAAGTPANYLALDGSNHVVLASGGGGGISGSGSAGRIPIWTGTTTQGTSHLSDDGTQLTYYGNEINTDSAYQLYGNTVLANPGFGNLFVGFVAGYNNHGGIDNTFTGYQAGVSNTIGSNNTAFGYLSNVGSDNLRDATAIGANATVPTSYTIQLGDDSVTSVATNGSFNTTGGAYQIGGSTVLANPGAINLYVGAGAGATNSTGTNITAIGDGADVLTDGFTDATALGANAIVQSSYTVQLGDANVTTVNSNGNFNTNGGAYQISGTNVLASPGTNNLYAGPGAGASNTPGTNITAIGANADVGAFELNDATAIGASAIVQSSYTIQLGDPYVTTVNTSGSVVTAANVQVGQNLIQHSENVAAGGTLDGLSNIYELTSGASTSTSMPATATAQVVYVRNSTGNTQTISGATVQNGQTATVVYFPTSGWAVSGVY